MSAPDRPNSGSESTQPKADFVHTPDPANRPSLAPPGAGLPKVEQFFAKWLVRWKCWRTSREEAAAVFVQSREDILAIVRECDDATGEKRVLIPRLRGLEDSSRFWSVFMVLDHLRIVNDGITAAIGLLVEGKVPPRAASTAAVKPREVGRTVLVAFEESCAKLEAAAAAPPSLKSTARYAHPWFGPLDAAGWHVMAGFHMNLHLGQIDSILRRMPQS